MNTMKRIGDAFYDLFSEPQAAHETPQDASNFADKKGKTGSTATDSNDENPNKESAENMKGTDAPKKCKPNMYNNASTNTCVPCPEFSTSEEHSTELSHCKCDHGYKMANDTCQQYTPREWRDHFAIESKVRNLNGKRSWYAFTWYVIYEFWVLAEEYKAWQIALALYGASFIKNAKEYDDGLVVIWNRGVTILSSPFKIAAIVLELIGFDCQSCIKSIRFSSKQSKSIVPNKVKNGDKKEEKLPWQMTCDRQWKCLQCCQVVRVLVPFVIVSLDIVNKQAISVLLICLCCYACSSMDSWLYHIYVIKAMSGVKGYARSARSCMYDFWLRKGFDYWMWFFHIPFAMHLCLLALIFIVPWPQVLSTPAVIMDNMACWHCVEMCVLLMVAFGEWQYNRVLDEKRVYIPKEWFRLRVSWNYLPLYTPEAGESGL